MELTQETSYIIYSDGACSGNPGPGGWGFILYSPQKQIVEGSGFAPSTTNNRMEMTGALEALRRVPQGESVIVLTDSVYVIRGITQWVFGWKKRGWKTADGTEVVNQDLWEELLKVCYRKNIEWRYIPGHKGFAGNERVDKLAVAQSQRQPLHGYSGPYSSYSISILPLPEKLPLPEMKMKNSTSDKANSFYLSLVNGVLESHDKWEQCQARVKGVSQARFKKVSSQTEASEVIQSWGLNPSTISLKR